MPEVRQPQRALTRIDQEDNLQFRCAFEACCTRLTYYQHGGCVTCEAEGRVHLPASRVRLERRYEQRCHEGRSHDAGRLAEVAVRLTSAPPRQQQRLGPMARKHGESA